MGKTASSSPPSSRRRFLRNPSAIATTSEPGWLMLREDPPAAALMRFSKALRRFAASLQKTGLYHEIITWAYLLLINERMERTGRSKSWPPREGSSFFRTDCCDSGPE